MGERQNRAMEYLAGPIQPRSFYTESGIIGTSPTVNPELAGNATGGLFQQSPRFAHGAVEGNRAVVEWADRRELGSQCRPRIVCDGAGQRHAPHARLAAQARHADRGLAS